MRRSDVQEAATVLGRVLGKIAAGELDAAPGLAARLEGATAALEATGRAPRPD